MEMTVKQANEMLVGTERIVTGGLNTLGPANGTFVTESIGDGQWRITKFPGSISRSTARTLLMLQRHGPLLLAGRRVLVDSTREVVRWITPRMVHAADGIEIEPLTGRVTMTNRGRGFFWPQEHLVFYVPADKEEEVRRAIEDALNRHYERSEHSDQRGR